MRIVSTPTLMLVLCLAATPASSQAPDSLSFQGFVTSPGGDPINNAGIAITFKLYEGATEIWSETQPSVTISGGVFNVLLGSVTPLDTVRFNRPLLLGIKVGTDPEIVPRTPLAAAAYAKALPGLYTFFAGPTGTHAYNVVGGGPNNVIGGSAIGATISGGGGFHAALPVPNQVLADFGTVGGGVDNTAGGEASTVGGGESNTVGGDRATVGGGQGNRAGGLDATVGGGFFNTAGGFGATVPGGLDNDARGLASFAAGHDAKAIHDGAFVWNDRSITSGNDSLLSTAPNQFLIRAAGGVGIGTNTPVAGSQLDVAGPVHILGSSSETILFSQTSVSGSSGLDDGFRFRLDNDFGGGSDDYLVIEKTDGVQNAPDGGVVFVNTGADGVIETALQIFGTGSVSIPGNLTKGSGSFKIDHPLDPTNKFLYHSFFESPDMMNVYDGVVTLDGDGEAEIELPAYFEALNRDFRYQLTCIGGFAPIFVSSKISNNRFEIAGGQPGMEVSWQVTGIRKDPFAAQHPIETEVDKAPHERGTYLHPKAYGRLAANAELKVQNAN